MPSCVRFSQISFEVAESCAPLAAQLPGQCVRRCHPAELDWTERNAARTALARRRPSFVPPWGNIGRSCTQKPAEPQGIARTKRHGRVDFRSSPGGSLHRAWPRTVPHGVGTVAPGADLACFAYRRPATGPKSVSWPNKRGLPSGQPPCMAGKSAREGHCEITLAN